MSDVTVHDRVFSSVEDAEHTEFADHVAIGIDTSGMPDHDFTVGSFECDGCYQRALAQITLAGQPVYRQAEHHVAADAGPIEPHLELVSEPQTIYNNGYCRWLDQRAHDARLTEHAELA